MKDAPKGYCTSEENIMRPIKLVLTPPGFTFTGPRLISKKEIKKLFKALKDFPVNADRIYLHKLIAPPIEVIESSCRGFLGYKTPHS